MKHTSTKPLNNNAIRVIIILYILVTSDCLLSKPSSDIELGRAVSKAIMESDIAPKNGKIIESDFLYSAFSTPMDCINVTINQNGKKIANVYYYRASYFYRIYVDQKKQWENYSFVPEWVHPPIPAMDTITEGMLQATLPKELIVDIISKLNLGNGNQVENLSFKAVTTKKIIAGMRLLRMNLGGESYCAEYFDEFQFFRWTLGSGDIESRWIYQPFIQSELRAPTKGIGVHANPQKN